jgi:hypothetical protein
MAQKTPTRAPDLLWRLEASTFDLVEGVMRLLSLDLASDFGASLLGCLEPRSGPNLL